MGARRKNRWNRWGGRHGTPTIQRRKTHFAWWPRKAREWNGHDHDSGEFKWIWFKSYFTASVHPKHH